MNIKKLIFLALFFLSALLPVYAGQNKTEAVSPYPAIIVTPDKKEMVFIPSKTKGFYIDKYEITFGEFARFVKETDYEIVNWTLSGQGSYQYKGSFDDSLALEDYIESMKKHGIEKMPVICVTLDDAKAYAKWAGKRIPTVEEWMLAAGGRNKYKYSWGKRFRNKTKDIFYDLALKREKTFEKMSLPCDSKARAFDKTDWGNRFVYGMGTQPFEWTVTKNPKKNAKEDEYIIKGAMYNPLIHYFEYEMRNSHETLGQSFYRFSSVGFRCVLDVDRIEVER